MNIARIIILRPDNIGDVVLFSGALQHIRSLYPEAHITLAVQAHIINLVELCPYIDACVPVNKLTWWGKIENFKFPVKHKLEKAIHSVNRLWNIIAKPFDIIIFPVKSPSVDHLKTVYCMHPKKTYGIIGCSLCAPKSGYPPGLSPETLFTQYLDVSKIDTWQHELLTTLAFLRFMGCHVTNIDDIKPRFWLADSDKNYLDGLQRKGRKIIGLFPGASFEGRRWESSYYGKLTSMLGGQPLYAIFGSHSDMELSERVVLSIRDDCDDVEMLNLTGQTTLRELARSIMSCDLLISMDTSGLHIAIAVGVATIGIVGGGHFGRFVPWGDAKTNVFLTNELECFHCNWACTKHEVECINGVSPYDVMCAAKKLLYS